MMKKIGAAIAIVFLGFAVAFAAVRSGLPDVAVFIGALAITFLLRVLTAWVVIRWVRGYPGVTLANVMSGIFAVVAGAFGSADGGPPAWGYAAAIWGTAQCVWLTVDLIRVRRARAV